MRAKKILGVFLTEVFLSFRVKNDILAYVAFVEGIAWKNWFTLWQTRRGQFDDF